MASGSLITRRSRSSHKNTLACLSASLGSAPDVLRAGRSAHIQTPPGAIKARSVELAHFCLFVLISFPPLECRLLFSFDKQAGDSKIDSTLSRYINSHQCTVTLMRITFVIVCLFAVKHR